MLQTIWKERRDVPVTFSLINRTTSVRVADEVDERFCGNAGASRRWPKAWVKNSLVPVMC